MSEAIRPHRDAKGNATRDYLANHTDAEKAITAAIGAVEALGPSRACTEAVVMLQAARNRVADHVEGIE